MNTIDTPEFRRMLTEFATTWYDHPGEESKRREIFKYIDAKLARVQDAADLRYKELAELHERIIDNLQTMALHLEDARKAGVDMNSESMRHLSRATAAEAKLAALSMEVETLMNDAVFFMGAIELHALDGVAWGERAKELLHPPKADESGLPG